MIALALLKTWGQPVALVGALTFGAVAWHAHNESERKLGIAEERGRVADSLLTVNATQLAKIDTVYRHDTVTLAHLVTKTHTLRDSLLIHITDTLRVKEFIASSDSAIQACRDVVNDCQTFHNLAIRRFGLDSVKLQAALAAQPNAHWYDGRIAIGPGFNLAPNGKSSVGVSVQLSVLRFP